MPAVRTGSAVRGSAPAPVSPGPRRSSPTTSTTHGAVMPTSLPPAGAGPTAGRSLRSCTSSECPRDSVLDSMRSVNSPTMVSVTSITSKMASSPMMSSVSGQTMYSVNSVAATPGGGLASPYGGGGPTGSATTDVDMADASGGAGVNAGAAGNYEQDGQVFSPGGERVTKRSVTLLERQMKEQQQILKALQARITHISKQESTCWSQIASLRRAQEKREQHDAISFQKRKRAEALYHQELDRLADVKVNVEGLKKERELALLHIDEKLQARSEVARAEREAEVVVHQQIVDSERSEQVLAKALQAEKVRHELERVAPARAKAVQERVKGVKEE